jgi:hypothetical protein
MGTLRKMLSFIPFIALASVKANEQKILIDSIPDLNTGFINPCRRVDRSKATRPSKTAFQKRKIKRTIQEHSRVMNRKNQ